MIHFKTTKSVGDATLYPLPYRRGKWIDFADGIDKDQPGRTSSVIFFNTLRVSVNIKMYTQCNP